MKIMLKVVIDSLFIQSKARLQPGCMHLRMRCWDLAMAGLPAATLLGMGASTMLGCVASSAAKPGHRASMCCSLQFLCRIGSH